MAGQTWNSGRLEVSFRSLEELAESLLLVARILETDTDRFAEKYEPQAPDPKPEHPGEIEQMFAELERMEAERGFSHQHRAQPETAAH